MSAGNLAVAQPQIRRRSSPAVRVVTAYFFFLRVKLGIGAFRLRSIYSRNGLFCFFERIFSFASFFFFSLKILFIIIHITKVTTH